MVSWLSNMKYRPAQLPFRRANKSADAKARQKKRQRNRPATIAEEARENITPLNPQFLIAMAECRSNKFKNVELAARHSVSPATITYWMKKAGIPPRRRGRRQLEEPNDLHRKIIELSQNMTGAEIARRFDVSRQRVNNVLRRWSQFRPNRINRGQSLPSQDDK